LASNKKEIFLLFFFILIHILIIIIGRSQRNVGGKQSPAEQPQSY
jgi:hypothetical protein